MEIIYSLEEPPLRKTVKQIETEKMRNALMSIAREMQKYQEYDRLVETSAFGSPESNDSEKVLAELLKCKTKIKCKKHRIHKLRKNLKTACLVAKTIASAKEDESGTLKHDLDYVQNECATLKEKDKNNTQIINSLSRDNTILRNKLNRVVNFIRLGYKELQRMRHELPEDTSVLAQLRKLIVSCGEYYAESCTEQEKCLHFKQRNTFLENKITFLEKNVKALTEELRALEHRNFGFQKDSDQMKKKSGKSKPGNDNNIEVACTRMHTEVMMKTGDRPNEFTKNTANEFIFTKRPDVCKPKGNSKHNFDLSPHLSIVKKLLNDQDILLKDLRMLSQEFLISNSDE